MTLRCDRCERSHEVLPDLALLAPDPYLELPEGERTRRASFTSDWCAITHDDGATDQFLRGVLYVPLRDAAGSFCIGMWVSQSRENLLRYLRGEPLDRTFGWLSNHLPHCGESAYGLKACLHFHEPDLRPTIELLPCAHDLAVDATFGVTLARAWEIVHAYAMH